MSNWGRGPFMEILHGVKLAKAILAMLDNEDGVRCAVAFWGPAMGKRARTRKATVILDLSMQGTSRNALKALGVKREALPADIAERVRVLDRLHAKLYLGHDAAIIGSANASTNALGRKGGKPALWEAGVLIDRVREPAAYKQAEDLWEAFLCASRSVRPDDLDRAPFVASTASARDLDETINTQSPSILDAVLHRPDDFKTVAFIFGDHDIVESERRTAEDDYEKVHGEPPQATGRNLICIFWEGQPRDDVLRSALRVVMFWFGRQAGIYAYHDIVPVDHGGRMSFFGKRHWPTVSAAVGLQQFRSKETWDADRTRGKRMSTLSGQAEKSRFVILPAEVCTAWLEKPND